MDKFHKMRTTGLKIGGISLKNSVCLFGPSSLEAWQLGFPTAHFCYGLSLDQAGTFRLQLLCDLVLAPLTGSQGFFHLLTLRDVRSHCKHARFSIQLDHLRCR